MHRITACFCGSYDPDAELLRRLARRRKRTLEPSSPFGKAGHQVLWAFKYPNSYSVPEARFLPDGDTHSIEIRFEGEGAVQMKLIIDNEEVFEVDSKQQRRGEIDLCMNDGMVVDFLWDLVKIPKTFSFYTRNRSSNAGGAGSGGDGDGAGDSSNGVKLDDYHHVYALEVLGM